VDRSGGEHSGAVAPGDNVLSGLEGKMERAIGIEPTTFSLGS
jgi:hypothetical protein